LVPSTDSGDDFVCVLGPVEGGGGVGFGDEAVDGFLERDERVECATFQPVRMHLPQAGGYPADFEMGVDAMIKEIVSQ
jgi:hypothetical protein